MLIKLENGIPVGNPIDEKNFRTLHNNTSFPRSLTVDCVEPFGYGLYQYTRPPVPGTHFKVEETVPVKNSDGIYMQTWETKAMSAEEIEKSTELKKVEIKRLRDEKLKASDWTMMYDVRENDRYSDEFIQAWLNYREDLREISTQKGYPWNIRWPIEPTLTK
jgi:hypothetical protein